MDIDMLGKTSNEIEAITQQVKDIIATSVEPDGITFDDQSIIVEKITEDADYEGIRVSFKGKLDNAMIYMQIDIGFGDKVYPAPSISAMPTIIALSPPEILCYSKESAIAEKFEAMVKLGEIKSTLYSWVNNAKAQKIPVKGNQEADVGKLHEKLDELAFKMNRCPRKCLEYKMPQELFIEQHKNDCRTWS